MKTVYVVASESTKYNDEYYHRTQGFDLNSETRVFSDKEKAKEYASKLLEIAIEGFDIGSFEEMYDISAKGNIAAYIESQGEAFDDYYYGLTYTGFIAWAKENNLEWRNEVPNMVDIKEITYED